ncbi:MAG: PilZ domain-containing protein [Thermodesulfobacteriota bacterium]|jgi:hypothetical protein
MSADNPVFEASNRRRFSRKYMLFKIPAYDAQSRRFLGLVQDISEKGVQLFGVEVGVNARRTLIIQASDYIKGAPLQFEAQCRWTRKESTQGYYVSGFEITSIGEESRRNLGRLIEFLTIG